MAYSQTIPPLIPLSKQIYRDDCDIIAIRNGQTLHTKDLKDAVISIYHQLNTSKEHHWALVMQDSFHFVAGLLALLYCGKHPILINPLHQDLAPYFQAILTDNDAITAYDWPNHNITNITQLPTHNIDIAFIGELRSTSLTLFTSGSTGLPKPVNKTLYQLEYESHLLSTYFGSLSQHLFIASVSHDHMYGLTFKIMLALSNRATFVCESIQYQEQLAQYNGQKIIYITTPSLLKMLDCKITNVECDQVISAGGPLAYHAAQYSLQCFGKLPTEIYGSSETGIIATRTQVAADIPWQLFPQMQIINTKQQSKLMSPLIEGAEPLNDQIELIDQYTFTLKGRTDKIIKISEKRVSLTYIENQLSQLAEIAKVCVIPLEQKNRTILAAVVQLSEFGIQQKQQLGHFRLSQYFRQQLKDKLSLVTIPKKWRFVEQLPTNKQGKSTFIALKTLFDNIE